MEDVLALYEKPLSGEEPVVCVDEKSVSLHEEVREPILLQPGRVGRRDSEYKRCGTANVFCGVEPKAGVHFTAVTPTRAAHELAGFLKSLASGLLSPSPDHPPGAGQSQHPSAQGTGGSLWGARGPGSMEAVYVALHTQTRQLAESSRNRNRLAGPAMFGEETAGRHLSTERRGTGLESTGESSGHSHSMEV